MNTLGVGPQGLGGDHQLVEGDDLRMVIESGDGVPTLQTFPEVLAEGRNGRQRLCATHHGRGFPLMIGQPVQHEHEGADTAWTKTLLKDECGVRAEHRKRGTPLLTRISPHARKKPSSGRRHSGNYG